MNQQIAEALSWRYATKKFDAAKKLPEADLNALLEAGRHAPSSYGLQPWKFIVVEDAALRASLRAVAWDQPQVTDASHLVVLCRRDTMTEVDVAKLIDATTVTRNAPAGVLDGYRDMMLGSLAGKTAEQLSAWNARQVYIALGFMLESAALMKIDACPMEGFDNAKFDELLGLGGTGYTSTVLCALGYRDPSDSMAPMAKVRYSAAEVIERK